MADQYLQLVNSKFTEIFIIKEQMAFALLSIIALRACRTLNHPLGLKIGEALIGDWEGTGFSEQNYRTAKKKLIQYKLIEIVETNRTRKKSTTGVTTTGTKVRLLDSRIYDINPEKTNDSSNDCLTTDQRLPNDEQESIRKNKKEKKNKEKIVFHDCVSLTEDEITKLKEFFGSDYESQIESYACAKKSRGYDYKSDYHVLCSGGWFGKKYLEKITKSTKQGIKSEILEDEPKETEEDKEFLRKINKIREENNKRTENERLSN
jgi:hypothetical protein